MAVRVSASGLGVFSLACEFATGVLGLLQIGEASAPAALKIDGPDVFDEGVGEIGTF